MVMLVMDADVLRASMVEWEKLVLLCGASVPVRFVSVHLINCYLDYHRVT